MSARFIIALNLDARRSGSGIDLFRAIAEAEIRGLHVIERARGGKSVTVEMPATLASEVRRRLPFAIVEPAVALSLLS